MINAVIKDDADIVIGGYRFINYNENRIEETRNAKDWDVNFNNNHNVFQYSPWAKLFKRTLLLDNHILFSEGEQIEDGPFSIITNMVADRLVAIDALDYKYYNRENKNSQIHQITDREYRIKLPKEAILDSIKIFNNSKLKDSRKEMFEYCILKELVGLTTNVGKNFDSVTRHELCEYCYEILDKYFPTVYRNQYTGLFVLKKLPFSHRAAVKLFLISYKLHLLYPFSWLVGKVL